MKRKVLLAMPALQEVLAEDFRQIKYSLFPPLSLLTLAAMTPRDRFDVIVRDEHVEPIDVENGIDLVGMTVYVSSARRSYELADRYRRRGATVVLGGIHPTTLPREAAEHADAVCIGPAETVWHKILDDFEAGTLARFYRGEIAGSAAHVPTARRELMNPAAYLVRNTIVTSRGCPHHCAFCYKGSFWGDRHYEARPIADIEREIQSFEGSFVFILDDNFLADRNHAREVFAILRQAGMVWQAAGSLEIARHPAYLAEAYEAGCRSLFVGFESLSRENMRMSNKAVNARADYAEAVHRFHDAGIMINGSFVFGLDADGPDVFDRTIEFAIQNKIETATFHILTPFPGTPLFQQMQANNRLLTLNWSLYDTRHAVFRPRRLDPQQLEDGYWRCYDEFYRHGSIFRRSIGLPKPLKRIAYNLGWKKMDPLWAAIIKCGLLPYTRSAFERILAHPTAPTREPAAARSTHHSHPGRSPLTDDRGWTRTAGS